MVPVYYHDTYSRALSVTIPGMMIRVSFVHADRPFVVTRSLIYSQMIIDLTS